MRNVEPASVPALVEGRGGEGGGKMVIGGDRLGLLRDQG